MNCLPNFPSSICFPRFHINTGFHQQSLCSGRHIDFLTVYRYAPTPVKTNFYSHLQHHIVHNVPFHRRNLFPPRQMTRNGVDRSLKARQVLRRLDDFPYEYASSRRKDIRMIYKLTFDMQGMKFVVALAGMTTEMEDEEKWPASWNEPGRFRAYVNKNMKRWVQELVGMQQFEWEEQDSEL